MTKKLDIDIMAELHQKALDAAEKALFETNYDKHGWTKEEFYQHFTNEAQSVEDYEAFVKPLIANGTVLLN